MDLATDDQRAWALAPSLVLVRADGVLAWTNPATGTTCRLDPDGEYAVLRRSGERTVPVVAGQVRVEDAERIAAAPDEEPARRAAAQAILAVDR